MQFNLYSSVRAKHGTTISLSDLLTKIKTPKSECERALVYGKGSEEYSEIKTSLEAFRPNSFSLDGSRNSEGISTGYLYLDFDGFESEEEAHVFRYNLVSNYPFTALCWLSLSRVGLSVLIRVKESNRLLHRAYLDFLRGLLPKNILERMDNRPKDYNRLCVIPHDDSLFYNSEAPALDEVYTIGVNKGWTSTHTIYKDIICTTSPPASNAYSHPPVVTGSYAYQTSVPLEWFEHPNTPYYAPEGHYIYHINLAAYKSHKIKNGYRTSTLGAWSLQLMGMYPNASLDRILLKIMEWNRKYSEDELSFDEVQKLVQANYSKFHNDNYRPPQKKRIVLWHPDCQLSKTEKQSLGSKYRWKSENKGKECSTERIQTALAKLKDGQKITKKRIHQSTGLSLDAIKAYWKPFKNEVEEYNRSLKTQKPSLGHASPEPYGYNLSPTDTETDYLSIIHLEPTVKSYSESLRTTFQGYQFSF